MKEYFVESVVLGKEPLGEMDARVFLYSDTLGKVSAKIRSARRITSKLNAHLEPLNLAKVRLIEKNTFQVADALRFGSLPACDLKVLKLINSLVFDNHLDSELWDLVKKGNISISKTLAILGFDPEYAVCGNCGARSPEFFNSTDSFYYCGSCFKGGFHLGDFIKVY